MVVTRTSVRTVIFAHPFVIGDLDDVLPPGGYVVEEDEERIPGVSYAAYRRVRTVIQLPATTSKRGDARTMTITPEQLQKAIDRDMETSNPDKRDDAPEPATDLTGRDKVRTRTLTGDMLRYGITSELSEHFFVDGYRYGNLDEAVSQAKRSAASK